MKSCRQIKIFQIGTYYKVTERQVNEFCENHEVIDVSITDRYVMVYFRDLKEETE